MADYKPDEGDQVRVVIEGTVGKVDGLKRRFQLGWNVIWDNDVHVKSVERLTDPEPEWQDGDVVINGVGDVWQYSANADPEWNWYAPGSDSPSALRLLKRPLTLIVRGGKAVSGD